jgi:hypothetical protein
MASEPAVRLTSKLYEMRDAARQLLGSDYARRMAAYREPIETVQAKLKLRSPIMAAAKICENVDAGGFEVIFIMAAVVEMLEPSRPPQAPTDG